MRLRLTVVAVAAMASAQIVSLGCGYSLAGRGSFLPAYIRTVGIPLFENRTQLLGAELTLTESVRSEFISRGRYEVSAAETGVDAVLRGQIASVTVTPSGFNEQQLATRYVITLSAKLEFRDLKSDKVLWENPSLAFREEYEVATGSSATDASAFFGQEANALDRVATAFARSVVASILEAF